VLAESDSLPILLPVQKRFDLLFAYILSAHLDNVVVPYINQDSPENGYVALDFYCQTLSVINKKAHYLGLSQYGVLQLEHIVGFRSVLRLNTVNT
jgi:hypothetical protein